MGLTFHVGCVKRSADAPGLPPARCVRAALDAPYGWPALVGLYLTVNLFAAGCHRAVSEPVVEESPGPVWFEDITERCGLQFVHDADPEGHFFMPQIMGAGAALFDFDQDGRLDILLLQSGGPGSGSTHRLFRQMDDGRFADVSKGSGLDLAGYAAGVAIGDVNNDGRPDVVITEYGGVRLFLNRGGTFVERTREAGLVNLAWGTSAAFVDYDRDGWLDLVVVNYVAYDPAKLCYDPLGKRDFCHPSQFTSQVTRLYRNQGIRDQEPGIGGSQAAVARFEDVTEKAGLARLPGPGLGVHCADFDGDGWIDILVANDGQPNRLWVNQHDGTFKDEAVLRGLAYNGMGLAYANMGIAVADVDGNGLFDVFITHLTQETNTLWLQEPRGFFRDRTVAAGLAGPKARGTGFGTVLADFDHDGLPDLAVVNGRVARGKPANEASLGPFWGQYAEPSRLFANDGKGRFRDLSQQNGPLCGSAGVYRGLACGDVDGDGALDLLVTAVAGPARLYRNVAPKQGHWLSIRATDPAAKRDAFGAEITLEAGNRRLLGFVNPGSSYLCSHAPFAHFGLGKIERIDALQVRWPDGSVEVFPGTAVDRRVEVVKGQGVRR